MVKNETFLGIYFILDVIRWWSRVENGNGNGSNEVGEERWWEMGMVPGCEIRKFNIYIYIYKYIYIYYHEINTWKWFPIFMLATKHCKLKIFLVKYFIAKQTEWKWIIVLHSSVDWKLI